MAQKEYGSAFPCNTPMEGQTPMHEGLKCFSDAWNELVVILYVGLYSYLGV